jgi:hypothetical protein
MAEDEPHDTIDLERFLQIAAKVKAEGRDALDQDELEEYERVTAILSRWARQAAKGPAGREADHSLGLQLLDLLPEHLIERWGELTPADLGLLARALPDALPEEARRLLP